jgi:MSHA biogenesis protein MshL
MIIPTSMLAVLNRVAASDMPCISETPSCRRPCGDSPGRIPVATVKPRRGPCSGARAAIVTALALLLPACASISPGWRDASRKQVDAVLDEAKGETRAAVPGEVSQALLPPLELRLPDGKTAPLDPRFDLAVNNAPARQVFMGLVEGTPYSMVLAPGVGGTISLNLKDVTVPEAMRAIRQVYGYEFRREGNRFFVLGREMQTRLFNVNYLHFIRKGKSDTRVAASGLTPTGATAGGGTTAAAAPGATQSGVRVETDSQADFWKELIDTANALIGTGAGRKVIANPQANLLVVRAMPDELRAVEEFLGQSQAIVSRQVVLEAKFVEVELKDGYQAGINWAALGSHNGDSMVTGQIGVGTVMGNTAISTVAGDFGNLVPPSGLAQALTEPSAFGNLFAMAYNGDNFKAFLELLQTQGELNVLSSPRVSTLNNQKAVIKVGTDSFFVTKQDITQSGTIGIAPTVTTELSPFFSGIALDVLPQIDETGNVLLHVHPSITDVTEKKITIGGTGVAGNQISTAESAVQESDNVVRVASGQVVVIGGLMKEGVTDKGASVPVLGDIPVLGYLFKQKRVVRVKRELVILIKPTVINNGGDWTQMVDESQERVKKYREGS